MTTTTGSHRRLIAMRTMMIDAAAVEAFHHLADHGVPSILLKGRVLATWLYGGEPRNYGDVDLLVSPAQRDRAVDLLADLGYRHHLAGAARSEYGSNEIELLRPQGPCIDLHHTLIGVEADPEKTWAVLSSRTTTVTVAGAEVTTLDETARTMHLALHVAQNGPIDTKALHDLELGVAQLPGDFWRGAAGLAEAVQAEQAFAGGLRLTPAGAELADAIGLGRPRDVSLLLRVTSAPQEALQIDNLVRAESTGARLRLVARKLWPTRAYMAGRDPSSIRTPVALLRARLERMGGLPRKFWLALQSWRDANRMARATIDAATIDPATIDTAPTLGRPAS